MIYEGFLTGEGLRVAIVAARFNELITSKLVGGANDAFRRHGVAADAVDTAWVL
ncbi:MAG TPA: 6,7-dimethyl-8-ribityllumazine synthase, partial [Exiguobacterium sp.]|nr:6,7-dimethyl-8-ribityllumazine synthase [Exiguobacterium sp.]